MSLDHRVSMSMPGEGSIRVEIIQEGTVLASIDDRRVVRVHAPCVMDLTDLEGIVDSALEALDGEGVVEAPASQHVSFDIPGERPFRVEVMGGSYPDNRILAIAEMIGNRPAIRFLEDCDVTLDQMFGVVGRTLPMIEKVAQVAAASVSAS